MDNVEHSRFLPNRDGIMLRIKECKVSLKQETTCLPTGVHSDEEQQRIAVHARRSFSNQQEQCYHQRKCCPHWARVHDWRMLGRGCIYWRRCKGLRPPGSMHHELRQLEKSDSLVEYKPIIDDRRKKGARLTTRVAGLYREWSHKETHEHYVSFFAVGVGEFVCWEAAFVHKDRINIVKHVSPDFANTYNYQK